ncbi:Hint domain-containing protein [Alkalilacustris brevis]|uniref:Hint domain-containing protein n=1 Tax=Alkalilacustris brevis TaxID=2026338 RepID=UPI000E0D1ED2|nr:Hint domain-containing protein [Alkalilacustris brevis]
MGDEVVSGENFYNGRHGQEKTGPGYVKDHDGHDHGPRKTPDFNFKGFEKSGPVNVKGHDEDGHKGHGRGHEEHGQGHGYGHRHDDGHDDKDKGPEKGGPDNVKGHDEDGHKGHGRGHEEHGQGHGYGHQHGDGHDEDDDCESGQVLLGTDGDDTLIGTDCDDVIVGGPGGDLIKGGAGDDTLMGGIGSDTISGGKGDDVIIGGAGSLEDYTATVTLHAPSAAYQNTLGFYFVDPVCGEIMNTQIAFENSTDPDNAGETFSFFVPPHAQIGAFIIAQGATENDFEALGEGEYKFLNANGEPAKPDDEGVHLVHLAKDGTQTPLDGKVYHSVASGDLAGLNPDGEVHIEGMSENDDGSWTFGFEDIFGLGDRDFDDVVFTIDLGNSGATLLNPDFDATADLPDGDPDSSNKLFGGDGDDVIYTGAGADKAYGGKGDDTFYATPGDTIDGGKGFDALYLPGQLGNIEKIKITKEVHNPDGSVSQDGYIDFKDGSDRLEFISIEKIIPCFTPGTVIATPEGERLVESLREGDKVITRDNGIQEIRWIGARRLDWRGLAGSPHLKPVLIEKGSLGNDLPERDMLVSPQHRVLVANERTSLYFDEHEVLVAAKHLVNHSGVREVDSLGVTYVHFMCDRHEVVLSNGAWSETFQPGDYTLKGMGNAQRLELFELFPDLQNDAGREAYGAARKTLKRHEARLLAS